MTGAATHRAMPAALPLARYRFECVVEKPIRLHEYAGSMLRGAFGTALRHLLCVTGRDDCKACPLYRSCQFPAIFAPPPPLSQRTSGQAFSEVPAAYVIEPPARGEALLPAGAALQWHLVLFGRALGELPLIIAAWRRALAQGLGPDRGSARLCRVVHCRADGEASVLEPNSRALVEHSAIVHIPPPPLAFERIDLHCLTPLHLQRNGKPLDAGSITPDRLLIGLIKRLSLLQACHAGDPWPVDHAALATRAREIHGQHALHWQSSRRYSARHQHSSTLGGLVGHWQLRGDLAPFWPWLHAGQWLHVGKHTSFGLGHYRLDPSP
ncbi:MAG: CRISPR system precrRNA processing endoribonuclease RAMP protein Cas6 [Xanthomonadaceae bacterium]|nr:CRISPR system precrRNA processing endoribonuclease RAMP protein Cas6 [Xanthomonadaceae bacterium]MDP2185419.1 CRISPR system precrRNA processing endoribonuclease RAMP protein Cas6 [Xanthomonadales bacterium]MDZ4116815.1 CRISPR system precrRNA processing endoribonuclease RAMP protein Cas6 [Xanthomonadaceae bacterium]MDZ4379200.1 CRISPR system precrRNA processing endoribonuclease RAMP protein Cas6 [Xanthomonadaceae bacterium]